MDRPLIGVIGASGYTGSELVRLLINHAGIKLGPITSETHAGKMISEIHPHLLEVCEEPLISIGKIEDYSPDLLFLALPHGVSMRFLAEHPSIKAKVIDLSGDFRLGSAEEYKQWYKIEHVLPERLKDAVYGLPEVFRDDIAAANLVANPGCYPTSSVLALWPLVRKGAVETEGIIVDSKSGISGAGATAKPITHYPRANEEMKAYNIGVHRHTPEMERALHLGSKNGVKILFTPHLAPMSRGILTTTYCKLLDGNGQEDIDNMFFDAYYGEPFVRMRIRSPSVQSVRGSNFCDVHVKSDARSGRAIVVSVIDNLVKGAAGQAIQNMNIMLGLEETMGLKCIPLSP
jgi:N-acetyl-gamma-glutamyl-phosphate reductase